MDVYYINRKQLINQSLDNLIEANLLLPSERERQASIISKHDNYMLLMILLESHNLKEMYAETGGYYPELNDKTFCNN